MIYALDIETKGEKEDEALNPWRSEITCVGVVDDNDNGVVYRDWVALAKFFESLKPSDTIVCHNGSFDFKTLIVKHFGLSVSQFTEDTLLQAVALPEKISETWLEEYNRQRTLLNKELGGQKDVHRKAGKNSLKTLAPFFLGVDPFWEQANHDSDEYVLKDCRYTLQLWHMFNKKLKEQDAYDFYKKKLMPWARTLLEAEIRGIRIDLDKLKQMEQATEILAAQSEEKLYKLWAEPNKVWYTNQVSQVQAKYHDMLTKACAKMKNPTDEKLKKTLDRYDGLRDKAIEAIPTKLNIASPSQLMWVLKDYYGLDVTNIDDDPTTGKSVLNKLAEQGRGDVEELLRFRALNKLKTSFFPTYNELQEGGIIHCNFNMAGTRTGRLSCGSPNLQQTPAQLHQLFVARPGYKLICRDLSGIEPVMIAYLTEDPVLCDILINDGNFHNHNTRTVFSVEGSDDFIKKEYARERKAVKEWGLSILYGAGVKRVQESTLKFGFTDLTFADCRAMHTALKEEYEYVFKYKKELDRTLMAGETITNLLGRPIKFDDPEEVYMKGFNRLVQSSASDLLLQVVQDAKDEYRRLGLDAHPLLWVHDEIVIEAEASIAEQADKILLDCLAKIVLDTRYGRLPLASEGGVFDYWAK